MLGMWRDLRRSPAMLMAAGLFVGLVGVAGLYLSGLQRDDLLIMTPVLACYAPLFLVFAAERDQSKGNSAEDLDRLVALKRRLSVRPVARSPRAYRSGRSAQVAQEADGVPQSPEEGLNRLVAVKRRLALPQRIEERERGIMSRSP
jgi:hypothetical protein